MRFNSNKFNLFIICDKILDFFSHKLFHFPTTFSIPVTFENFHKFLVSGYFLTQQKCFIWGGSSPRSNPCQCTLYLSVTAIKCICLFFLGPLTDQNDRILYPFKQVYFNWRNTLPFHVLKPGKGTAFIQVGTSPYRPLQEVYPPAKTQPPSPPLGFL